MAAAISHVATVAGRGKLTPVWLRALAAVVIAIAVLVGARPEDMQGPHTGVFSTSIGNSYGFGTWGFSGV